MTRLLILLSIFLILTSTVTAADQSYEFSPDSIYQHLSVLAHDSLEGRQVGEPGAWKAAQYIKAVFEQAGLKPKGDNNSYFQALEFVKRIDLGENNFLTLNGVELEFNEEFRPMKQSVTAKYSFDDIVFVDYGIETDTGQYAYNDYADIDVSGKAVVIKRFAPSSEDNPHVDFEKFTSLTSKINTALSKDAAGIFFITPENEDDTMLTIRPVRVNPKKIPIIFLRRAALQRLGIDLNNPQISSAAGETEIIKTRDTAFNVIGYLPAENDTTIITGAHFDHLGYGTSSSRYLGGERLIHNGADDNGSGTGALLELARYYASRQDQNKYSLLFAAFTGEEEGLLGSSYYSKHMTVDSSKVRMMINMDMIGRLKDQDSGLAIFGTGTSEAFKTYFDSASFGGVTLTAKESGTGPSDHTAFYNRGIPVLHFFTGAHNDYHKPSDDVEFIDLDGTVRVAQIVSSIIDYFDAYDGDLIFQKTKDPDADKRRSRYSVTLGVMPDYIAEVTGLKIDGVTPDRPAEVAGIIEGDIIIKMGKIDIGDIYDYMNSLSQFRKGDTTIVIIQRGGKELELTVIFE